MKKYEKTKDDSTREANDLRNNPIMRWLQNQDAFKFNVGDILIKKSLTRSWDPQAHAYVDNGWVTETINKTTGAPKKYVYAFENTLGIGYIRQLKVDGSGYTSQLICVANFDPDNTRFELDPDFVDHTLVGEGDFQYNTEYLNKKKFRDEAMAANRKILIKTSSEKPLIEWFLSLKPGDEFWHGHTFDELTANKYVVRRIVKDSPPQLSNTGGYSGMSHRQERLVRRMGTSWQRIEVEVLETNHPYSRVGSSKTFSVSDFSWAKVTKEKPHPMTDPLCVPQK